MAWDIGWKEVTRNFILDLLWNSNRSQAKGMIFPPNMTEQIVDP